MPVKVTDKGWNRIALEVAKSGTVSGKVGWFAGSRGDGVHHGRGGKGKLTNGELAGILHVKRPFLSRAFDQQQAALLSLGAQLAAGILAGKVTVKKAVGLMCLRFANDVKVGVASRSLGLLANTKETERRKGSTTPLVDRGRLLTSLSFRVDEGAQ